MPKISVAIATYNGQKYIKEQLLSIIHQTVLPDEIVISDDGSSDQTLRIIETIAHENKSIEIKLLTDNPNHGVCGNFEWALSHTDGDIIILSDQDDVWRGNKIEIICDFFRSNPAAQCVFHNAGYIDENGYTINGRILNIFPNDCLIYKLDREVFLERAVTDFSVNGMVECISKDLLTKSLPFPKITAQHDKWLLFLSLCENECYYLNMDLGYYRLHSDQVNGQGRNNVRILERIARGIKKLRAAKFDTDIYYLNNEIINVLNEYKLTNTKAYNAAVTRFNLGAEKLRIKNMRKTKSIFDIISLYKTNPLYHSDGYKALVLDLMALLKQ